MTDQQIKTLEGRYVWPGKAGKGLHWDSSGKRLVRLRGQDLVQPGTVYLAGPMRGLPMSNFPKFLTAGAWLKSKGLEVQNPAEKDIDAGFDFTSQKEQTEFDLRAAFRWDFQQVLECDAVVLLEGWEKSTGASAERLVAELCGKETYLLTDDWKFLPAAPMEKKIVWTPMTPL